MVYHHHISNISRKTRDVMASDTASASSSSLFSPSLSFLHFTAFHYIMHAWGSGGETRWEWNKKCVTLSEIIHLNPNEGRQGIYQKASELVHYFMNYYYAQTACATKLAISSVGCALHRAVQQNKNEVEIMMGMTKLVILLNNNILVAWYHLDGITQCTTIQRWEKQRFQMK